MSNSLRPCPNPWCGSNDLEYHPSEDGTNGWYGCIQCGLIGPTAWTPDMEAANADDAREAEARRLWNDRQDSPMDQRAADRLVRVIDAEIRAGRLDSRSAIADARLDYERVQPNEPEDKPRSD